MVPGADEMDDPGDYIQRKLPSWARWEPDVADGPEENESDPLL